MNPPETRTTALRKLMFEVTLEYIAEHHPDRSNGGGGREQIRDVMGRDEFWGYDMVHGFLLRCVARYGPQFLSDRYDFRFDEYMGPGTHGILDIIVAMGGTESGEMRRAYDEVCEANGIVHDNDESLENMAGLRPRQQTLYW